MDNMIIPILLVKKLRHKELNSLPVVGHTEQMEEPTPEFQSLGSSLLRIMRIQVLLASLLTPPPPSTASEEVY